MARVQHLADLRQEYGDQPDEGPHDVARDEIDRRVAKQDSPSTFRTTDQFVQANRMNRLEAGRRHPAARARSLAVQVFDFLDFEALRSTISLLGEGNRFFGIHPELTRIERALGIIVERDDEIGKRIDTLASVNDPLDVLDDLPLKRLRQVVDRAHAGFVDPKNDPRDGSGSPSLAEPPNGDQQREIEVRRQEPHERSVHAFGRDGRAGGENGEERQNHYNAQRDQYAGLASKFQNALRLGGEPAHPIVGHVA